MLGFALLLLLPLSAFAAFSPNASVTIVSDLDDVLRITELWNPLRAIRDFFTDDFQPVNGMPELYRNFSQVNGTEFAYITDGFVSWSSSYTYGLQEHYPPGNAYFRVFDLSNLKTLFNARQIHAQSLIDEDPDRKFILVGDFATPGLINAYAKLAIKNSRQIQCLIFFDVRATNPANWLVPTTKPLTNRALSNRWTVFETAEEFKNDSITYLNQLKATTNDTFGCGSLVTRQKPFLDLIDNTHYTSAKATIMTLTKGLSAMMQCLMILPFRPSPLCRFDRREETWYPYYKKFESEMELRTWKKLPNTVVNGTKYERMCYDNGTFWLLNGTCEQN
ncbi:uncharacterized protein RHO25_002885 [Cercospora beticola]|uniref:Phosphatidate phosphatase APP1 catalytic domain-containing protein n=1 Tax=Cercospora beticola TaxID=122368 RepID=A0ABZ0NFF7_CERBT|nr:hypothetical protein RHO25_002885 [Cercospora beticola]CAK1359501.1 unnamed protein product [Cercospora beticola]